MFALLKVLLENVDLLEEIVSALAAGADREAIRIAIRGVKVAVSDAAVKAELGIDF